MPPRLLLTFLAALAIALAVGVASVRSHPGVRRTAVVAFPFAPGLRQRAPVTYLGVDAGTVQRIDLSTGRVVVTLGLRRADVVLRVGDTARLRTIGLFGDGVVDLAPGPRTARVLGAGDTLVGVAPAPPPPPGTTAPPPR